ncbi:hypothetical protein BJ508DRAFT_18618 [Ascobolus immersus RN42]|uniref:Uncharacterized protein n=1 Tax=Ascobolus immersus RN42 TaxID=1160509 RepID=A0A3N4HSM4_ASCIM|nr:hypothetical protein BJ508DRAFT_18618 [Ascobolus immersus RN42]
MPPDRAHHMKYISHLGTFDYPCARYLSWITSFQTCPVMNLIVVKSTQESARQSSRCLSEQTKESTIKTSYPQVSKARPEIRLHQHTRAITTGQKPYLKSEHLITGDTNPANLHHTSGAKIRTGPAVPSPVTLEADLTGVKLGNLHLCHSTGAVTFPPSQ